LAIQGAVQVPWPLTPWAFIVEGRPTVDGPWTPVADPCSFLNQPIEVEHLRGRVGELTGRRGFPQILLRLGTEPAMDTRRPAKEVVIWPV